MLSIEESPAEVADLTVSGHWEGDLILGKYKRSTIRTQKDAISVRKAFVDAFKNVPEYLKMSFTYDQGKEMSEHEQFTINTNKKVYFAHPASPWERGTNENTNGLIRQYFPKGTDFYLVSVDDIKEVQDSLNDSPSVVLNFLKPDEVFILLH